MMMTAQPDIRFDIRFARPAAYALAAAVALGCGGTTAFAQQSEPHFRTIPVAATPIIDRLRPDDEVVQIKYEWDIVVSVPAQPASVVIEETVAQADLVAIVDVTDISGFLALDGIWINTRITGTLREVLRSSTRMDYRGGQPVEVQQVDGEMKIGNVLVRANGGSSVQPHHCYLMFLQAVPGESPTTVLFPTYPPLEIDHGELVSHRDYYPGNVVFREGLPVALIDFDLAKPTTRLYDIALLLVGLFRAP